MNHIRKFLLWPQASTFDSRDRCNGLFNHAQVLVAFISPPVNTSVTLFATTSRRRELQAGAEAATSEFVPLDIEATIKAAKQRKGKDSR